MNKIINKFLLSGDEFMPELYLLIYLFTGFTYSAGGLFTKHCEIIQNLKKRVIYNIYIEMT